jgi:hypothetical protein
MTTSQAPASLLGPPALFPAFRRKNQTNPIPVGRARVPIVGPPAFFHDAAQKTKRTQFSRNSRKANDLPAK